MIHLKDIDMIDYLSRSLPEERMSFVDEHLAACDRCRARLDQLKSVWDFLGGWETSPARKEIEQQILEKISESSQPKPHPFLPRWFSFSLRVAASIFLAMTFGFFVEVITRPKNPEPCRVTESTTHTNDSDYLELLEPTSATGLTEAMIRK